MDKIIFKLSNERLTASTGLPIVRYLLRGSKFIESCNKISVDLFNNLAKRRKMW